jgi:AhpD family alkylhydroperoxidase
MARLNYLKASPDGTKALGAVHSYVKTSGLSPVLIDLVYLRISLINGCAYCIDTHTQDLLKAGMPQAKITLLPVWHEAAALFDERERAALAWAETVTLVAETNIPDEDFQAARAVFNEKELADLTIAIGLMNAYNRLAIGFRSTPPSAKHAKA